jgi:hypothetical protein
MKVVLLLWMLVNGQPVGDPQETEVPNLGACYDQLIEAMDEAAQIDNHSNTVIYIGACRIEKAGGPPA